MSKKWTFLTLILLLGSGGALQAQTQDSPDIVYIDGSPCNRACQSYMEWSYRALSARRHEARETYVAVPAEGEADRIEPVARPRVARHAAPISRAAPHAAKAASNGRTTVTKGSSSTKIAASNAAPQARKKEIPAAALRPQPAASETAAAELKPAAKSEVATAVTPPPPATLEISTPSAAPAPGATSGKASEAGKTASASPDDLDNLVALVLARPEINSLSDLNDRSIAIAEKQSASSGRVSAALMAAGAAEVRFSEVKTSAIDRLIDGAVPAAVVLAPRDVANLFPEVDGFRTFRVPLSMKARL
jgi:hypothetical protein